MSFHNSTNDGRVARIVETLDLLEKSAQSNKIDSEQLSLFLQPVYKRLVRMAGDRTDAPVPSAPQPQLKLAPWHSIREFVDGMEIRDLPVAMASIMTRISEEVIDPR